MGFFESIPRPPPRAHPRAHRLAGMLPSDAVLPQSVPADVVLFRSDAVAVAVGSILAFPNGFEFTVRVRLRLEDRDRNRTAEPFDSPGSWTEGQILADALRLGVLYADGSRGATTRKPAMHPGYASVGNIFLDQRGAGGNSRRWDGNYWAHSLPPEGTVTFLISWPKHGVEEARAEVDGAAIRKAAQRAVILWPDDPDCESDH